jgi:hypothetical protein
LNFIHIVRSVYPRKLVEQCPKLENIPFIDIAARGDDVSNVEKFGHCLMDLPLLVDVKLLIGKETTPQQVDVSYTLQPFYRLREFLVNSTILLI